VYLWVDTLLFPSSVLLGGGKPNSVNFWAGSPNTENWYTRYCAQESEWGGSGGDASVCTCWAGDPFLQGTAT